MALNIKNTQVERLVDEIARITGESKTEAIRQALVERRNRLRYRVSLGDRAERLKSFLEREVWPRVPAHQMGRAPDRAERERILGYGEGGV
ncbi:MAG: type II toxin-antitoxin system VapB family antitoxin [Gemmatimonadota bacterium]